MVGVVTATPFVWHPGDRRPPPTTMSPADRAARTCGPGDLHHRETGSLYLTRTQVYERE